MRAACLIWWTTSHIGVPTLRPGKKSLSAQQIVANARSLCPWCKFRSPRGCVACNVNLHSRGQCRWNMGAHPIYSRDAVSAPDLCPDCWTTYAQSLAVCPRRRRVPPLPGDLLNHMRALTESCQPAAGSTATLVLELRLRRVHKWVQSHIRAHGRCSMDALLQALLHRVQAADANCARAVLGQASRALCVAEKTVRCIAVGHAFLHSPRPARTVRSPPSAAIWLTTTSN